MLFFLLDLCRESWLLLEPLPSADRLDKRRTRLEVSTTVALKANRVAQEK